MTKERQNIKEDFYSGDTKDLVFTIYDKDEALFDLSNAEGSYALFDDEGTILLQKSSHTAGITFNVPNSTATVHLLPHNTIRFYGTYRHQLSIVDQNNYDEVVSTGKVNIKRSFARRYRLDSTPAFLQGG